MFWGLAFSLAHLRSPLLSAALFLLLWTTTTCAAKAAFGWIWLGRSLRINCGPRTGLQLKNDMSACQNTEEIKMGGLYWKNWLIDTISLAWQCFFRTWTEIPKHWTMWELSNDRCGSLACSRAGHLFIQVHPNISRSFVSHELVLIKS